MEAPSTTMSPTTATTSRNLVTTPEPWPPIFLWGARPMSLDAELMLTRQLPQEEQDDGPWLIVDCPNGNSSSSSNHSRTPEEEDADDECLRASLFPAEVNWWASTKPMDFQTWGGTFLPASKTWRCEAEWGDWSTRTFAPMSGRCSQWESEGGESAAATTSLDQCDVMRQRVPVRITAGVNVWGGAPNASLYWGPPYFNTCMRTELSSAGCPKPTSLVNFAAATTTSAPSGTGSASRGERAGSAALICVVLACASVVAGLLPMSLY